MFQVALKTGFGGRPITTLACRDVITRLFGRHVDVTLKAADLFATLRGSNQFSGGVRVIRHTKEGHNQT